MPQLTRYSVRSPYKAMILDAMPGSPKSIKMKLGIPHGSVHRWLTILIDEKLAHIYKVEIPVGGGRLTKHYKAGEKPKDKRLSYPKIRTDSERNRDNIKRLKASGEWDFMMAKKRAKYHADKLKPHPLMAMYGIK